MYSLDDKIKAVKLYIKYGKSAEAVIRELGYPNRHSLVYRYKEYVKTNLFIYRKTFILSYLVRELFFIINSEAVLLTYPRFMLSKFQNIRNTLTGMPVTIWIAGMTHGFICRRIFQQFFKVFINRFFIGAN